MLDKWCHTPRKAFKLNLVTEYNLIYNILHFWLNFGINVYDLLSYVSFSTKDQT